MDNRENSLELDIQMLRQLLSFRLKMLSGQQANEEPAIAPSMQFRTPCNDQDPYDRFLLLRQPSSAERLVLLLALLPHIQPGFFDAAIAGFFPQGGDLPLLGGMRGSHHRGMIPTGETAIFLLDDNDMFQRHAVRHIFCEDHFFAKDNILYLENPVNHEPAMSGRILLSPEYEQYFMTGKISRPKFGPDFPAKLLTTDMEWKDLILPKQTMDQIDNIKRWFSYNDQLMEDRNLAKRIKPGYRILFHGPPGTGKTLTAALLGKYFEKDVYRIDLSQVISKYIGETEKNLEKVFSRAEHHNWILFFDEADALFGKRSNIQNAHDRYANQEIAYLLQRVEDYPGLIILSSNYKNNIDKAFARRFNEVIHFPVPNADQRYLLWEKAIPENFTLELNLRELANKYEITGAGIMNVIHYAALKSMAAKQRHIQLRDVLYGIQQEFHKEDKFF